MFWDMPILVGLESSPAQFFRAGQCLQVLAKLKVVDDCRSFINVVRPMINRPQFHLQTLHYWMFIAVAVPYNHITTCSQLHLLVRSPPDPPRKQQHTLFQDLHLELAYADRLRQAEDSNGKPTGLRNCDDDLRKPDHRLP